MNTSERLHSYQSFDQAVIEKVAQVAERQAVMSYEAFFEACELQGTVKLSYAGYAPVEILDINPDGSEDKPTLMVHLPMTNPLDPNNLYQIATLSACLPNTRILASGNPTHGYNFGILNRQQRTQVARGDFRPTVEPLMKYAESQKLSDINQYGYSYGADKAVTAAATTAYNVEKLVTLEPASVVGRSIVKLALDFGSSSKHLDKYVSANKLPAFNAARKDSVGMLDYYLGLMKLTNIAVARGLSDGKFEDRLQDAFISQSKMETLLAWGTDSELASNSAMDAINNRMIAKYGFNRVRALRLIRQTHALANDLALQAAVVLTSISN